MGDTVYEIEVGIATATEVHVLDGVDVNVSVDGGDGDVTLAPSADGAHGYTTCWAGEPAHWVSPGLLAYVATLPDARQVLRDLAHEAGAEADARPPSAEDIAEANVSGIMRTAAGADIDWAAR